MAERKEGVKMDCALRVSVFLVCSSHDDELMNLLLFLKVR